MHSLLSSYQKIEFSQNALQNTFEVNAQLFEKFDPQLLRLGKLRLTLDIPKMDAYSLIM